MTHRLDRDFGLRSLARAAGAVTKGVLSLVALALFASLAGAAESDRALSFARHGEPLAVRSLDALIAAAAPAEVRVFEPYEGQPIRFRALPFDRVLDAVYGAGWRDEEELLLTCSDGYQPGFPVQRLLDHRAWLAFERVGAETFSILKRESGALRRVDLSPFYLVWENLDDPIVREEGDYGWPYQLVGVDMIRARDRYPQMMPPEDAPDEVRAGFAAFRVHCSRCHKINGQGGEIGPELNTPVNPVEYRDEAWLRQWLDDPASLVPNARMPALNPALADRARTIDALLAYLGAMSKNKLSTMSKHETTPVAGDPGAN